jgi:hypothetical protein
MRPDPVIGGRAGGSNRGAFLDRSTRSCVRFPQSDVAACVSGHERSGRDPADAESVDEFGISQCRRSIETI